MTREALLDTVKGLPEAFSPALEPEVEHRWFGRYGVVAAPAGGSYLRLEPLEFDFTMGLDGSADRTDLEDTYGPDANDWLELLWEEGFLVGSPQASTDRVVVTRQGIEISGVDSVVRALYRVFGRWVFTRAGAVVWALVTVVGIAVFVAAVGDGLPLRAVALSPIVAVIVIEVMDWSAAILHEIAHAFVLVHAGRRVGRVGMGFYWGLFSFYVDASDGMLADRRTRMLQAAAGVMSDLFWAGLALGATAAFGVHGTAADLCRQFAVLRYVTVAMNAVPLLELDGYHFLSDALERPELKVESSAAARDFRHAIRDPQRRRLALYGLTSALFGVTVLATATIVWWRVFGDLFSELVHGNPLAKAFGVYLVLPYLVMLIHLAATARRAITERHNPDSEHGDDDPDEQVPVT